MRDLVSVGRGKVLLGYAGDALLLLDIFRHVRTYGPIPLCAGRMDVARGCSNTSACKRQPTYTLLTVGPLSPNYRPSSCAVRALAPPPQPEPAHAATPAAAAPASEEDKEGGKKKPGATPSPLQVKGLGQIEAVALSWDGALAAAIYRHKVRPCMKGTA